MRVPPGRHTTMRARRAVVALCGHPLGAALTAGLLTLAIMLFGPPGGDAAAHLYLTEFWREHGWQLWDNFWYSGRYAQINYSLLFYPLAAHIGLALTVAASVAGAAGAFTALVRRRWPTLAAGPTVAFTLLMPIGAVAGTYPFLLGLALALIALAALDRGRRVWALIAIALTGPAHPLALAFLVASLASIALTIPRWWRRPGAVAVAATVIASCALQAVLLRGFATSGAHYPFDPLDALAIVGFCAAGLALTRGLDDQRPLRAVFIGYGAFSALAFAMSSPLGGNVVRLLLLMGAPLLALPLAARGFRPRGAAVVLLAGVVLWQALPAVAGWRTTTESRAQNADFWYPAIAFIDAHLKPGERVQVVATADNWEAYYLAGRGVPLARGWFRQDDFPANRALYEKLTPARYTSWLRRTAVRYVLLPDDPLDYSAQDEATLLRSGRSGLRVVARIGSWTMFEYPDAQPLATPARDITVAAMNASSVTLIARRAGTYRLRVRYTPYWKTTGVPACAAPMSPWGTALHITRPGRVTLTFNLRLGTFVGALLGDGNPCAGLLARDRANDAHAVGPTPFSPAGTDRAGH
ncbi:MAG TPA: hypothetical protein PKE32_07590 [Miltoncostaeaceae bacterium]|nr:hypothetical protein [Miltoncostaeaceae bacterium]